MIKDGTEIVVIRCTGGPHTGDRFVPLTNLTPTWPPPRYLPDTEGEGGRYQRLRYSTLPDSSIHHPHIARGAEYVWIPNGVTLN